VYTNLVCNRGFEVRDTTATFRDTRDGRSAAVLHRCSKLPCGDDSDAPKISIQQYA
jgi:hypothetical protein